MARLFAFIAAWCAVTVYGSDDLSAQPETGISGVYEVMVGTDDAASVIDYFGAFGFRVVKEASLSAADAQRIYGVASKLTSYRLQNGDVDAHGLLRILEWDNPLGPGVGYAPGETVGQYMAVMRTKDIFRIDDVFRDLREKSEKPFLPTTPVYDDLYDMDSTAEYSITKRRTGVREMAVYGEFFNHVFFQRYGYTIPGYGTIGDHAPLKTSEFTHHDFNVKGDLSVVTDYYVNVLGFTSENDPVLDGDWQAGPNEVFQMEIGESHWYRGFVSPNDISGKLKFFSSRDPGFVRDRSAHQRVGEMGITLHSLFTPKLAMVHELAVKTDLNPSMIQKNEFGEQSFLFKGPDGVSWQILEAPVLQSPPVTVLQFETVDE